MIKKSIPIPFILISLFYSVSLHAQTGAGLPRSLPEAEGVSSAGILRFIEAAEKSRNELHSFMFLRHGKVIAEGWWDPYKPALRHTIYSAGKTFTSTAVGFAVNENLLKLSDKVISFFPNDLPDTISSYLAQLTVRDLLTMSDGQEPDPTFAIGSKSRNWVKAFLATPIVNKPGTVFLYNSMETFMLSAIVQKVTGQKLIDYLKPRLFDPLGIVGVDWEENLLSVNTGGWGLRLKTEDMARVGQLYLQKGNWNGNQILPAAWIEEATKEKIFRNPGLAQSKKDSSDWEQGYGYQIWICRHHAYRADGAFGQYIIVFPEQDAVIAIQAESPDMQDELNLVWEYLLPSFKKDKLPNDQKSLIALKVKLSSLGILPVTGSFSAFTANKNMIKTFILEPNESQIGSVVIEIKDSVCHFIMNTGADTYNLYFGAGKWKSGQTNKPGPSYFSYARENYALLLPYKVAGNFYWKDEQTLVMVLRYVESPHTETFTCHFEGKKLSVDQEYSLDFGKKKMILTGVEK
jgi:CubicO group peptidase (beta-lactamase class C family)